MTDPSFEKGIGMLVDLVLECEPGASPVRRAQLEAARNGETAETRVMRLARARGENVNVALARYRIEGRA